MTMLILAAAMAGLGLAWVKVRRRRKGAAKA